MIARWFRGTSGRTAAEWFAVRLRGSDAMLDREFDAWMAEDPAHGEEYALCEITWEVSQGAAREVPPPTYRARRVDGATVGRRAAVFAIAAAALAAVVWFRPPATLSFATAAGEQRTLVLEDGSRVTLNTRTRIGVRFGRHAREIVLDGGEAFFEVSHDASRPFTVRTPIGSARALGTRFDMYLEERQLSVTTADGSVLVDGPIAGNGVVVGAGSRAELRAGAARATVEPADLTAVLGWLTRRLEANNALLADVLSDFSRYTTLPIRASTPAVAQLRVSAVLRTGDLEALQATLKDAFGLEIERRDGEYLVFDRKDREAKVR
jgi:transmembrane sensor